MRMMGSNRPGLWCGVLPACLAVMMAEGGDMAFDELSRLIVGYEIGGRHWPYVAVCLIITPLALGGCRGGGSCRANHGAG